MEFFLVHVSSDCRKIQTRKDSVFGQFSRSDCYFSGASYDSPVRIRVRKRDKGPASVKHNLKVRYKMQFSDTCLVYLIKIKSLDIETIVKRFKKPMENPT